MNVEEKAEPRVIWKFNGKGKGNGKSRKMGYEEPRIQESSKERALEEPAVAAAAAATHSVQDSAIQ